MMNLPKMTNRGFTMIELLVVIAVIGVLSVAVLSSINPIEQINKGRDTRTRSDAAQLINAVDRYYAIHETYPWNDVATVGTTTTYTPVETLAGAPDEEFDFDGTAATANIWNWADSLTTTAEVKEGFTNRLKLDHKIYVYKEGEYNATMYACFVPTSQAFKLEAGKNCNAAARSTPSVGTDDLFCDTTDGTMATGTELNYICLP